MQDYSGAGGATAGSQSADFRQHPSSQHDDGNRCKREYDARQFSKRIRPGNREEEEQEQAANIPDLLHLLFYNRVKLLLSVPDRSHCDLILSPDKQFATAISLLNQL